MADPTAEATGAEEGGAWSFLLPVLGAIGTGISVVGFVVFFGGMVEWARFEALGIPPNAAVSRVPRAELVATGASFLVPALLAALGAVAVAGLISYLGSLQWIETRIAAKRNVLEEKKTATVTARESLGLAKKAAAEKAAVLAARQKVAESEPSDANRGARDAAQAALDVATDAERTAEVALRTAVTEQRDAQKETDEAADWSVTDRRVIASASGLTLALAWVFATRVFQIDWPNSVVVAGVGVLGTAVALLILDKTRAWGWFAVTGFVAVGLAIAAGTYYRTQEDPKISPVAVVRDGGRAQAGFLVTRTGDSVIVAVPSVDTAGTGLVESNTNMVEVPSAKIVDMAVGPELNRNSAYRRALEVTGRLCARNKAAAAKPAKKAATKAATPTQKQTRPARRTARQPATSKPPARAKPEKQCSAQQIAALRAARSKAKDLPIPMK